MAYCILHDYYEPRTAGGCPTCTSAHVTAIVASRVGLCGCDAPNGCGHRAELAIEKRRVEAMLAVVRDHDDPGDPCCDVAIAIERAAKETP